MSADLKARARAVIEELAKLDSCKRPSGVHGQVIGMEPYVIRTNGDGLSCLFEAQSLLDELLDPFYRRAEQPSNPVPLTEAEILAIYKQSFNVMIGRMRAAPKSLSPTVMEFVRLIEARIVGQQTKGGGK